VPAVTLDVRNRDLAQGQGCGLGVQAEDHAGGVIQRGHQVPAGLAGTERSAQRLAVHRDHPPGTVGGSSTPLQPAVGRIVQGVRIYLLPNRARERQKAQAPCSPASDLLFNGVSEGIRTPDIQDHNLAL
jgi:hypothetical protein